VLFVKAKSAYLYLLILYSCRMQLQQCSNCTELTLPINAQKSARLPVCAC